MESLANVQSPAWSHADLGAFCTNEARALAAVMFSAAYPRRRRIVTGYSIRPQPAAVLICDCLGVSAPVPPAILLPVPRSDRNPGRARVTLRSIPPSGWPDLSPVPRSDRSPGRG